MKKKFFKKWLTLVELMIVIAILWLLAVGIYIWNEYYTSRARDTARKTDLHNIEKSLIVRSANIHNFPKPGNVTTETINGIEYESGEFSEETFKDMIELSHLPRDPKTKNFYTYKIPKNCDGYILTAHLENPQKMPDGSVSAEYTINTISNCQNPSSVVVPTPPTPTPPLPEELPPPADPAPGITPSDDDEGPQEPNIPETLPAAPVEVTCLDDEYIFENTCHQKTKTCEIIKSEKKIADGIRQNNGAGGYKECVPIVCIEGFELSGNECLPNNNLPEITGLDVEGGKIFAGVRVRVKLTIVDEDGDEVIVSPMNPAEVSIDGHTISTTFPAVGSHKIPLRLDDGKGEIIREVDFYAHLFPTSFECYSYMMMGNSRSPKHAWVQFDAGTGRPDENGKLGILVHNFRNYSWPEMVNVINAKISSGNYQQAALWTARGQVTCWFDNNDLWN